MAEFRRKPADAETLAAELTPAGRAPWPRWDYSAPRPRQLPARFCPGELAEAMASWPVGRFRGLSACK